MPAYYAPIKHQFMRPSNVDAAVAIATMSVDPVTDIVIENEKVLFKISRSVNGGSVCSVNYTITSGHTGDLSGIVSGSVPFASGQQDAYVYAQTVKAAVAVGDRVLTCTLSVGTNCVISPTKPNATSTLKNFIDTSSQWFKSLAYRSAQPIAQGINSWNNPPLVIGDYEANVNYIDAFAGNHFGSSLERIDTWANVQGGPDNSVTISTTGQFSWASVGGQFATPFNTLPTNVCWGVFFFAVFPTALRTDTVLGAHDAWDQINAGTHDQRFKDMGGRIAALCSARSFPLSKFICAPCPSPQGDVPYKIYASTKAAYQSALSRIAGLIRTGAGASTLRFAWCPAQNRQLLGEDFDALSTWMPAGFDTVGINFRPDAQITDRQSYDRWIGGTTDYYGLVGDVVRLSNTNSNMPVLIHNWGPRWQDCPIADLVYQWFYDDFIKPFKSRIVTACVFHNNTLVRTAAAAQGEPGNTAWSHGVDVFEGTDRWGGTVTPPPPPPIIVLDDAASTVSPDAVVIDVLANDTGSVLTITSVTTPAHGVAGIDANTVIYIPNAAYFGPDTFQYRATDQYGQFADANVTVTVDALPVRAVDDSGTVLSNTNLVVSVLANDIGNGLTISAIGTLSNGGTATRINSNTQIQYKSAATFVGTETFTYTCTDGNTSSTANVTIVVTASDPPPPTCLPDAASVTGSALLTISVLANDSGISLTVSAITAPAHGTSAITADKLKVTYKANADYVGSDTFNYTAKDSLNRTGTGVVTVTVNRAPLNANDDAYSAFSGVGKSLDVLANDTGSGKIIKAVTSPNHGGTVTIAADKLSITYKALATYTGVETFKYTLQDSASATKDATVTITVYAPDAHNTIFDIPFSKTGACNRAMGKTLDPGVPAGFGNGGTPNTLAIDNSRGRLTDLMNATNGAMTIDTSHYFMKYFNVIKPVGGNWKSYKFKANSKPQSPANPGDLFVTLNAPISWVNAFDSGGTDSNGLLYDEANDILHMFYATVYDSVNGWFTARYHHTWSLKGNDFPGDGDDSGSTGAKLRHPAFLLRLWEVMRINSASDVTSFPMRHALEGSATGYHSNPAPDIYHLMGTSLHWPATGTDNTNDQNAGNIPYGTLFTIRDEDLGAIDSTDTDPFTGYAKPGDTAPIYKLNLSDIGKWLFNGLVDHGLYLIDCTGAATDTKALIKIRVAQEDEANWDSWNAASAKPYKNAVNDALVKLKPLLWPMKNTATGAAVAAYKSGTLYYSLPGGARRITSRNYALDA